MSSITPPADDAGVQSLRQNNRTHTGVDSVSAVAPTRAIHQSTGAPATDSLQLKQRRRVERRREDRRREDPHRRKQNVLLDTRSHHDRRTTERRHSVNKNSLEKRRRSQARGVNIKV